jgi:putative integral membrane protein (TIGR02587 family)
METFDSEAIANEARDQGRGIVGALIVSVELLFTMEMWWIGWRRSLIPLFAYAVLGLGVVLLITWKVGFSRGNKGDGEQVTVRSLGIRFSEVVMQSLFAAVLVLSVFGILDADNVISAARLGLIFIVPLGFGAAMANEFLTDSEEEQNASDGEFRSIGETVAVFSIGSIFFAMTLAPTQEMERMAAYAGWFRLAAVVGLGVTVAYLVLYELEFRGHGNRVQQPSFSQFGYALTAYATGVVVSVFMLAATGHFSDTPTVVWVQTVVVLSFPAAIGAAAAEVIL